MEQHLIEVLLSSGNDLVKSKEVLQQFVVQHSDSSDFTATFDQWNVIWNAIFKILRMPSTESEGCTKMLDIYADSLAAIQIMSRDKRHLNQMITVDQFDTLLNIANIGDQNENNTRNNIIIADSAIIVEALKCLCNLVYESTTCQTMCSKIGDIDGIVRRLESYKDANNVFPYDLQYFDIKFLFLITGLNPVVRTKVRNDYHGLTYLVEIIYLIIKKRSDPQNGHQELNESQVNLLVEIMKVLFIITTVRNENASVATEKVEEIQFRQLANAMHALLLFRAISREKQIELRSNTMNLLSNVPTACYSELTIPMHVHVDSLVEGIDWSQKIALLRFDIEKIMDTTPDAATVLMGMPTLQSTISTNVGGLNKQIDRITIPGKIKNKSLKRLKSTSGDKSSQSIKQSTVLPKTECPDCGKSITKKGLDRHRREQHQSDAEKLKCSLCPFETKRATYLMDHKRRQHLEPTVLGRPKKNKKLSEKRKRTRSPFQMNKFEKRHKSALTMIEMNTQLNAQKDMENCEQLNGMQQNLAQTMTDNMKNEQRLNALDIEVSKFKTRVKIMESKQTEHPMPNVNNIPALLEYFNLKETCTKKDIDSTINLRLMESSPESAVSCDIFVSSEMTRQKRENMLMFYNDASIELQKWRKQRDYLRQSTITID